MLNEYTKIRTLVTKEGFPAGTIGIIVSFYASGIACEVEIWNKDYPVDGVTYKLDEIEPIE